MRYTYRLRPGAQVERALLAERHPSLELNRNGFAIRDGRLSTVSATLLPPPEVAVVVRPELQIPRRQPWETVESRSKYSRCSQSETWAR